MRKIIIFVLFLFLLFRCNLLSAQVANFTILFASREINIINNVNRFYDKILMEGDTSGYLVILISRKEGDEHDRFNPYDVSDEKIILKKTNAEMFRKLVLKYFEWNNLSKLKNVSLTKTMYSPDNFDEIDCSQNLTIGPYSNNINDEMRKNYIFKTRISTKVEIVSFVVTYEYNELVFKCQKNTTTYYTDNTKWVDVEAASLSLSYNELKKIKKIIDDGTYDRKIKEFKKTNNTWNEFKGF